MGWLNVAAFVACTEAEGPGRRAALWVQGCAKRCPGCCNPNYLRMEEADVLPTSSVIEQIGDAKQRFDIEGVTFLGGEPMLQAQGLAVVAAACQQLGLSVMVFTGYTRDELDRLELPGAVGLLDHTDVLVDGPYLAQQPETVRNWTGSTNQHFHYLTTRYAPTIETDARWRPCIELRLATSGSARVNGWPTRFSR